MSSEETAVLEEAFVELARELAGRKRVLCHRDFHSRNLMLKERELYIIDFQDARLGPDTYDLVSLLRDAYVDVDPPTTEAALDAYFRARERSEPADFRTRYARMAVQRHLKALGTFGDQAERVGTSRYADAVPRTLRYLREAFEQAPDTAELRAALVRHLAEIG